MITNSIQIRRRTPLPVMAYAVRSHLSGRSLEARLQPCGPHQQESRINVEVGAPSALMFVQNFVLENGDLGRPPLEWKEEMPPWLNGLRLIFSLG